MERNFRVFLPVVRPFVSVKVESLRSSGKLFTVEKVTADHYACASFSRFTMYNRDVFSIL